MYCRPAEWRKNKTIWLAWPWDHQLWGDDLTAAQQETTDLVNALLREHVVVVVPSHVERALVEKRFTLSSRLTIEVMPFGDIWFRDTFPIFVRDEREHAAAILPHFNGWGGKYQFADDLDLSKRVVTSLSVPAIQSSLVFEGGAIECNGEGTMLTTEQCLLNKNRNPNVDKARIEEEFARCFGTKKVIWIKEGLKDDHTDGHIDTIARFIAPHTIAIMVPRSKNDPNYDVLMAIKSQLARETDAQGGKFSLLELPSPGIVLNSDGALMPASYLNFIIGDETMVQPLYGSPYDKEAYDILKNSIDLHVVGCMAKAILTGGGAFHCMSQEFYR